MPTITVSDETYRKLSARAAARGVTIEEAIGLPGEPEAEVAPPLGIFPPQYNPGVLNHTAEERLKRLNEFLDFARECTTHLPPGYHADDSRESIYDPEETPE